MTELKVPSRSSANVAMTVLEADNVTPVDLTDGVVRFWAARDTAEGIERAIFSRRSYDDKEVLITDAVNGAFTVFIIPENTKTMKIGAYEYITEILRRGASATTAGTIDVAAGSGVLTGTGLDLDSIGDDDLLVPAGTGAENQKTIVVEKERDKSGALTGNLVTDYTDWTTETGISLEVFTVIKKYPVDLCGVFNVEKC